MNREIASDRARCGCFFETSGGLAPRPGKFFGMNRVLQRWWIAFFCASASLASSGETATLRTTDTQIVVEAGAAAPRLVSLQIPGQAKWEDRVSEPLINAIEIADKSTPLHWQFNRDASRVDEQNVFSNTMTVIDGASNVASSLKAGVQADEIVVNPATNKLYLTSYQSQDVTVIDGASDRDMKVAAGTHLWGIAVNPVTNRIYVANTGRSNVTVIDGKTNATTFVNTGEIPCALAVDSSSGRIYTVNYATDNVTVIDGGSNSVIATVRVGARPQAIAIDSLSHRVYVANNRGDTVTVIDGTNNSVIATVKTSSGPYAIAVDSATNRAFGANLAGGSVTVIDGRTLTGTTAAMPTVE